MIACSQLVKAGRGEDYWILGVADAALKTVGKPHEHLGGEIPCERLTEKPFDYDHPLHMRSRVVRTLKLTTTWSGLEVPNLRETRGSGRT